MFKFKSIHRRLTVFMVLPVGVLLVIMGYLGFIYTRDHLISQWAEAAILRLQRAAHHVDMRLKEPKDLLKLISQADAEVVGEAARQVILDQISRLDGVVGVNLRRPSTEPMARDPEDPPPPGMHHHAMHPKTDPAVAVGSPVFDVSSNSYIVTLVALLKGDATGAAGRIEVLMRFDSLISAIETTDQPQSQVALLVDVQGRILTGNLVENRLQLGEDNDPLEKAILEAMQTMPFGTVIGRGTPPKEVAGFYKLQEAPWSLVVISPAKHALAPITRFQTYYFLIGAAFIALILILIRWITGRTADFIKMVSNAAGKVARGDYTPLLPARTEDEVGELIGSFNSMLHQLEERDRLKETINLAMEVQQNLLPEGRLSFEDLDIAGASLYCDETGGDYFDFLLPSELSDRTLGVAVGDVSGHGVGAALLMTTARALLRSRFSQPGTMAQRITDVNHLLSLDTEASGNFMTLFFMALDAAAKKICWVRAGHDPAVLYDPLSDGFEELGGDGLALGVDKDWRYQAYCRDRWSGGQIIFIGTDGIWETENDQGEMFGKERLLATLRAGRDASAQGILTMIIDNLKSFQNHIAREDDLTLVVIKVV